MPYRPRVCSECQRSFTPKNSSDGEACRSCMQLLKREEATKYRLFTRQCEGCFRSFTSKTDSERLCPSCKKTPETKVVPATRAELDLGPPFKQAIFDLETWGLDRGWGVLLMGVILVHGDGTEPKWYEFDLTQAPGWPMVRGDDSTVAKALLDVLQDCDIIVAHNGLNFDRKYLNTIALKFGMPSLMKKLVDPVQKARQMYRIGSNSLSSIASYLDLPEPKMQLPMEIWRSAILNADEGAWELMRERCRSDVRILNAVCRRMRGDFGVIDMYGSAWR